MTFIIKVFTYSDNKLFDIASQIRDEVFCREQNVDKEIEFDEFESESTHYLIYKDKVPVGAARWRITEKGIKLERYAILKKYRKTGAGKEILYKTIEDVLSLNKKIYMHAQEYAIGFYKKYGFKVEGDSFIEADIVHFVMCYKPNHR